MIKIFNEIKKIQISVVRTGVCRGRWTFTPDMKSDVIHNLKNGQAKTDQKELSSSSCPRRGRNSTWSRSEQKDIAEDLKENGVVKKSRDSQRFRAKLADTRETNKEQN